MSVVLAGLSVLFSACCVVACVISTREYRRATREGRAATGMQRRLVISSVCLALCLTSTIVNIAVP